MQNITDYVPWAIIIIVTGIDLFLMNKYELTFFQKTLLFYFTVIVGVGGALVVSELLSEEPNWGGLLNVAYILLPMLIVLSLIMWWLENRSEPQP